jgi:four helix bundle protein
MSYESLEIWKMSRELAIRIHMMSLGLPRFEQFEEGQQIRRSIISVKSTIVEGYGRRYYKQEFIKFIIYALASNDEAIDHLETVFKTESLKDPELYSALHADLESLGRKINGFLQALNREHSKPNYLQEPEMNYSDPVWPESSDQNPES